MDARTLEKLLRGPYKYAAEECEAINSGRWAEYVKKRLPPPSRLNFLQYAAWRAACDVALRIGCTKTVCEVMVFPVWYGHNEAEEPEVTWKKTAVVAFPDRFPDLHPARSFESAVVTVAVEEARLGHVVHSRSYSPEIQLAYRRLDYGALEGRHVMRVVRVTGTAGASPLAAPSRAVPPFSTDAEPALDLAGLDPQLAARVQEVTAQLRIQPEVSADA